MSGRADRARVFWAFAAIYIIWGSTYLGIQYAIETIPPFTLAAVRFLIAGAMLYLWARWQGQPNPSAATWRMGALFGLLFFVVGNGLVVWAEQFVPSGRTALLASTTPIWVVIIESGLDGWKRPALRVIIGIVLGMVGLGLLATPRAADPEQAIPVIGILALLAAAIAWGGGSVLSHRRHLDASPAMATGIKMLGGGALLAVVAAAAGEGQRIAVDQVSRTSWIALVYLIVFGSILGFTAFTFLLRTTTPEIVGTSAYVNPLVAVLLGWAMAGELVTSRMMIGAGVSLLGVLLIRWPVKPVPPPDAVELGTGEFPVQYSDAK